MNRLFNMAIAAGIALGSTALAGGPGTPGDPPIPSLDDIQRAGNTYIVRLRSDATPNDVAEEARSAAGATGGQVGHVYTNTIKGFSITLPDRAAAALFRSSANVLSVERDRLFSIQGKPTCGTGNTPPCEDPGDPGGGGGGTPGPAGDKCSGYNEGNLTWGVGLIKAPTAWGNSGGTLSTCGKTIDVYVLDTGVDIDHPDLQPLGAIMDCTKNGACSAGGDDKNGHGTHVSGTIGARADGQVIGVAPGVTLNSVKVLGNGGTGSLSNIMAGIEWVAVRAVNKGKPVIVNMSLSGGGTKNPGDNCRSEANTDSFDTYHASICEASKKGVVFVVAAGNAWTDAETRVPAAYNDTVITVSAMGLVGGGVYKFPYWSNWGDGISGGEGAPAPIDVTAPGDGIESTLPGGKTGVYSGTSMAAPHVAGAAALFLESKLEDTNVAGFGAFVAVREALVGSADPTTGYVRENDNPHAEGLLDATFTSGSG